MAWTEGDVPWSIIAECPVPVRTSLSNLPLVMPSKCGLLLFFASCVDEMLASTTWGCGDHPTWNPSRCECPSLNLEHQILLNAQNPTGVQPRSALGGNQARMGDVHSPRTRHQLPSHSPLKAVSTRFRNSFLISLRLHS